MINAYLCPHAALYSVYRNGISRIFRDFAIGKYILCPDIIRDHGHTLCSAVEKHTVCTDTPDTGVYIKFIGVVIRVYAVGEERHLIL